MLRNLLKLIRSKDAIESNTQLFDEETTTGSNGVNDLSPSDVAGSPGMIAGKIGEQGIVEVNDSPVLAANHRAWLLSKELSHIKICNSKRCDKLAQHGVITAGDLAEVDVESLVIQMNAPASAIRSLKRYSAAIRLAASVPGMMPRDAQLLIRIHRHSIRAIAMDTPAILYQDLQRFAHSTVGQKLIGERRLPSMRKVKGWIVTCRDQEGGYQAMRAAA
jgi:hypothetical protein